MTDRRYSVEIKIINDRGENLSRTFSYGSDIDLFNEIESLKEILDNSHNYEF